MAQAFPGIEKIKYEGSGSKNPLAFKHYNAEEMIDGKTMADHLRFSVAYWHTFRNGCADPFGQPTRLMPWDDGSNSMANAEKRVEAAFEFFEKLGVKYYCFHDYDLVPEGNTLAESNANMDRIAKALKVQQDRTGITPLWGTSCLFANPRYMHGAGTTCNADVFAYAGAQVAKSMEVTKDLGGQGFVFWGGREGYRSLLNTDVKRELDHLAKFLQMAVDYKKEIGFDGQFYIEPKPKEPTSHQYDTDSATVIGFLRNYGLEEHFKMNIEANHATLAGHSFAHELRISAANGMLGSVDANRGDMLLGWDTDQFPTDIYDASYAMLEILDAGGLTTGGLNFDSHVTRESIDPVDLFYGHIGGMDTFARALKIASAIRTDGVLSGMLAKRYSSFDTGIGADIEAGKASFATFKNYIAEKGNPAPNESGRIELLENIVNEYI